MEAHEGEPFVTGEPPTDFNRYCFSFTDCPLEDEMLPGCAATMCAALESTGYKSTGDASAISYANYGTPCELIPGCIVVIEHLDGPLKGGHHVAFFVEQNSKTTVNLFGGNQNHLLCKADFSLIKNRIIAKRWPIPKDEK